jgi:hypothetical protein
LNRELSGIFVRVKVDEKWDNIDITDCTEPQIIETLTSRDQAELTRWFTRIAKQYNTMLQASDIDLEEIPDELVAECIKQCSKEELLRIIVLICRIYKMTGDVFDIRRA